MDPRQTGFHAPSRPKPYPSSNPSPSTFPHLFVLTSSQNALPKAKTRFSAVFPALYFLKDAWLRGPEIVFRPKTQIKVLNNKIHSNHSLPRTDNIMHPYKDPFSRARIPYLESCPPRYVKASVLDLTKEWESLRICKYPASIESAYSTNDDSHSHSFDIPAMKEEFNIQFVGATSDLSFPYFTAIAPKIHSTVGHIFTEEMLCAPHNVFATNLLDLIRHGYTSLDAIYITSQLLMLSYYNHLAASKLSLVNDIPRHLKILGRRLSQICSIYGHPESTFLNVQFFSRLNRVHAQHPNYHLYRQELLDILRTFAAAYPDTRAYTYMIALECTPGGSIEKARQYVLLSLERTTRPRGYEVALISAGKLLLDHVDALKALRLAIELLMQPIPAEDVFPFASRLRLIYKVQTLEWAADVLRERASSLMDSADARELLRMRDEVLLFRRGLKSRLRELGVRPGEEDYLFPETTMDEIMYQLIDPEAVLEEEEMMKIRPSTTRRKIEFGLHNSRLSLFSKGLDISPWRRKNEVEYFS